MYPAGITGFDYDIVARWNINFLFLPISHLVYNESIHDRMIERDFKINEGSYNSVTENQPFLRYIRARNLLNPHFNPNIPDLLCKCAHGMVSDHKRQIWYGDHGPFL